jgi:hypothetical protein
MRSALTAVVAIFFMVVFIFMGTGIIPACLFGVLLAVLFNRLYPRATK